MGITIKTPKEIEIMKKAGKILAETLEETLKLAKPGVSTWELDKFAEEYILSKGGRPGFKGYGGFPATLCTAVNDTIVHGIPRKDEILKEGDILTIDGGVIYQNWNSDAARSIGIGEISKERKALIATAKRALANAIDIIKPGIRIGDISKTIGRTIKEKGYHVIKDLTGHGIGRKLHEPPIILNFFDGQKGAILKPGMTIAIEPIFAIGTGEMVELEDGWTLVTEDGSDAIQQEESVVVTQNGAEILTKI